MHIVTQLLMLDFREFRIIMNLTLATEENKDYVVRQLHNYAV